LLIEEKKNCWCNPEISANSKELRGNVSVGTGEKVDFLLILGCVSRQGLFYPLGSFLSHKFPLVFVERKSLFQACDHDRCRPCNLQLVRVFCVRYRRHGFLDIGLGHFHQLGRHSDVPAPVGVLQLHNAATRRDIDCCVLCFTFSLLVSFFSLFYLLAVRRISFG